jgi:hypothetical protein
MAQGLDALAKGEDITSISSKVLPDLKPSIVKLLTAITVKNKEQIRILIKELTKEL